MGLFSFLFGKKKKEDDTPKITVNTISKPDTKDYSGLLDDVRNAFGKLYVRATECPVSFKADCGNVPDGVYFGKTRYTGQTNKNGKRGVALYGADGALVGTLRRNEWNNYEKNFATDDINWIGYVVDGLGKVNICPKFKEDYVEKALSNYGYTIATDELYVLLHKEVARQNLSTDEFNNKKKQKEKGYGDGTYDLYYNNRYMIAGVSRYVNSPFIAIGYAENEAENPVNPKAIAIYTLDGEKVGYIAEKELHQYYQETEGKRIPLVIEAHYYKGKLFGWLYTYTDNQEEYHYMVNQYVNLIRGKRE